MSEHKPVLFNEVLTGLAIKPDGRYVDATFGRGGHAAEILAQLGEGGQLLVIDQDPEAIARAALPPFDDSRVSVLQSDFAAMAEKIAELGWQAKVDGILFDCGVSSPQLDQAERGFSFLRNGPLDMRMNPNQRRNAADFVEKASEDEMIKVFKSLGEERYARRITRAIIARRKVQPFTQTLDLAEVIKVAHPAWQKGQHPATRCFQAIRMWVNDELGQLQAGLDAAVDALVKGGRLCAISFHSLEDRLIKRFIQKAERGDELPANFPVKHHQINQRLKRIANLTATAEELEYNRRARSARLRVAEKT